MKNQLAMENVEAAFKGHIILDCAIRSEDLVYLMIRPDVTYEEAMDLEDYQIPTRVVVLKDNGAGPLGVGAREYQNFTRPLLGVSQKPVSQALLVSQDSDGTVAPLGGGQEWDAEDIATKGYPQCKHLQCIDGYTWAVGIERGVYKRLDIDKWQPVNAGFEAHAKDKSTKKGFADIAGFSEQEIYAVGGKGDIWKYDGVSWHKCEFPSTDELYTVCCGKDGFVYVGSRNFLWRGRDNQWEQLVRFELPVRMKDLCWFDNKLWLAYDYSLQMWDGEQLHQEIIHKGKKLSLCSPIDASDDMLLAAGSHEVWTFDGQDWYNIVPKF
ncbi:hypothetical protein [Culicoidibacter larvae]|uniref:WD40 repeat domain-containing protein n=1 Tax=Culicoidibacter larvae TaxID=2579976 RepID=A0A5R8QGG4_9FIRM|nr:hypothetical protein [Culicoidibacter larvae]TLG77088.1 hypothetical protein FEZ08_00285 [Culicoidibacter larvae]